MVKYVVIKFGGSSLTVEGYKNILQKVIEITKNKEIKLVIVLSAVYNITNLLIKSLETHNFQIEINDIHLNIINKLDLTNMEGIDNTLSLCNGLFNNVTDFTLEQKINTIAFGEIMSTNILYKYLLQQNITCTLINAKNVIKTNYIYTENSHYLIDSEFWCDNEYIINAFQNTNIIIVPGFICSTKNNKIGLLSRGGGDTTASLIASSLDSEKLEIYTNVNGLFTGDPSLIYNSKLIPFIDYEICQEISAMGANVLHPYSIGPCKIKNIPIFIKNTFDMFGEYTKIYNYNNTNNDVLAILDQNNNTIFHIKSLNMWNNYGFVSDIFTTFSKLGIDINIITTSQFIISATTNEIDDNKIKKAKEILKEKYEVNIVKECHIISLVGYDIISNNNVNKNLDTINNKYNILINHYSSNNMCLSFVVTSKDFLDLFKYLHSELITKYINRWWVSKIPKIIKVLNESDKRSHYLYSIDSIKSTCKKLKTTFTNISKIYYAMKANNNPDILNVIVHNGFGIECVSIEEIDYIFNLNLTNDIIFTPNFCHISEYVKAFKYNILVIVDNLEIMKNNIDVFKNKKIGIRIDTGFGYGHSDKVITNGKMTKFGYPIDDIKTLVNFTNEYNIKVIGLHCHGGSGASEHLIWKKNMEDLLSLKTNFPYLEWLDLGGGIGLDMDIDIINSSLENNHNLQLLIEPGRYIIADSGILVSQVTQVREKGNNKFIGLDTGMNSLIRPTLYDAYHPIYNISKFKQISNTIYNIVGPICESGDILGRNRKLPETNDNDYILIDNTGAYGYVMSSNYNMRKPAEQIII